MSPETRDMLLGWIEAGTDAQRAHARHRLAMADADEPAPKVSQLETVSPRPTPAPTLAALRLVRRCIWRSRPACGCTPARCALAGRDVPDQHCIACVTRHGDA